MEKEILIKLIQEQLENDIECKLELSDGNEVILAPSIDFIGGIEGCYTSDIIGNVAYDNPRELIEDVLDYIEELGLTIENY